MISIQFSDAYERRFLLENDGMQFQQTTDCEGENDINCFRPGFSARFRSVTFPPTADYVADEKVQLQLRTCH